MDEAHARDADLAQSLPAINPFALALEKIDDALWSIKCFDWQSRRARIALRGSPAIARMDGISVTLIQVADELCH